MKTSPELYADKMTEHLRGSCELLVNSCCAISNVTPPDLVFPIKNKCHLPKRQKVLSQQNDLMIASNNFES